MENIVNNNISEIVKICEKRMVERLYTFGSINSTTFNSDSDIDFLVKFGDVNLIDYADNYFEMCDELEILFNRSIDLVTEPSLKNPYFKKEIKESQKLIFAA